MALNDIVRSLAGVICPVGLGLIWANKGPIAVVTVLTALPAVGALCYLVMLAVTAQSGRAVAARPLTVES